MPLLRHPPSFPVATYAKSSPDAPRPLVALGLRIVAGWNRAGHRREPGRRFCMARQTSAPSATHPSYDPDEQPDPFPTDHRVNVAPSPPVVNRSPG